MYSSKSDIKSPEGKIPVWLDCDPGHDDAFALLLTLHHPRLHALGVSTTHGNAPLSHTTFNALSLITAFRSTHVPVHKGAAHPLYRPNISAESIHGESGMDGTNLLPNPKSTVSTIPAVHAMARTLLATPRDSAWIVSTGAMTNIALLLRAYPNVALWIAGISVMGGAIGDNFTSAQMNCVNGVTRIGNKSVWAEFNILADPEAAQEVLTWPTLQGKITLIPLDISHLVIVTESVKNCLLWGNYNSHSEHKNGSRRPNRTRQMMVELVSYFTETYAEVCGFRDGPPLHDPVAVAVLLGDEVPFTYNISCRKNYARSSTCTPTVEQFEVKVDTRGNFFDTQSGSQIGRTTIKLLPPGELGVKIPRGVDVGAFWTVIENCLERVQ